MDINYKKITEIKYLEAEKQTVEVTSDGWVHYVSTASDNRHWTDIKELVPSKIWDFFLWISVAGMFAVGIWTIIEKIKG